jgi:hypothetical protein
MRRRRLEERLLRRIVKQENDGCWIWTGSRTSAGYGNIEARGKSYRAHRLAYKFWVGPIPRGHWVLRRCHNPLCCNPEHLYTSAGSASPEERLLSKIDKQQNGCWLWQGHTENGYGRIVLSGHRSVVHRVAYALWVEPVPEGLQAAISARMGPFCEELVAENARLRSSENNAHAVLREYIPGPARAL